MDSFFGIGLGELFFIAIIALIVLGPERLPGAIREVTKFIRTIRNLSSELTSQFSEEMKAFDDINPTKILRELTDEPEEANKGAAKSGAAATKPPATKPASKPVSTSAAKPKPATGSSTGASAGSAAKKTGTSTATSAGGATKPAAGSAGQTEKPAEATPTAGPSAEGGDENRILPPQADAPKETPAATSTAAPAVASEPPATQPSADIALPNASHIQDASNGAEPPAHAPQPASSEGNMVVDAAASRPAVSVNGAAKAEGDA